MDEVINSVLSGASMRAFLFGTFLTIAVSAGSTVPAGALSLLQKGDTPQAGQEEAIEPTSSPREAPTYLEKRSLPAITDAMRVNREHRRMFADLTRESRGEDNALTKYIKALDVRYAILAAVGDGLVRATTTEEVTEATAAADAVLSVRTDLDRVIGTTQMAIIDAARLSNGYFGACDSRGQLADGTKCVRVADKPADGSPVAGAQFWAQPWDAARFDAAPLSQKTR